MKFEDDEEDGGGGAPAWVVTYGDMMSLLLVFFIMLLSFSEIDATKYRALTESLREAFGSQRVQDMHASPPADSMITEGKGAMDQAILNELRSIIPQAFPGALPNEHDGRGYLLRVPGRVLFETGKADLRPEMKPHLRRMAELLANRPELTLRVDGHTDDVPISNERFASNWELSAARALAVVHFLIDECGISPSRLSAASFAESRPLVPNDSPEHRELNRRVEFRFVQETEGESDESSDGSDTAFPE